MQVTAYKALSMLRDSYFGRDEEDEAAALFTVPLLVLDDLGMEPLMQNVTIEQIYNLLNERIVNGLSTVISTNLSMENVRERYTDRVHSRLMDVTEARFINLVGKDVRQIKN